MRIIVGLVFSYFVWFMQSCTEVLPLRNQTVSIDSTYMATVIPSPQAKVVLLEEYTGASCVNCPDGHRIVKEISNQFGENVVAVGLHPKENSLSEPAVEGGEDLRTEEAKQIANNFKVSALPNGTIDRKEFDGSIIQGRDEWKQKVINVINNPVKVNAKSKVSYDDLIDKNIFELEFTILEDIAIDLTYSIMLIENKVNAPQKKGSDILNPYIHEHVLRKMLTNSLGSSLKKVEKDGSGYKKGRVFLKKISLEDFTKTKYKSENLYLVSFVSNGATNEVIQTTITKVKN